ncbi:hypothetical protein EMG21_30110, partial [Klebsiella pneumoniae]
MKKTLIIVLGVAAVLLLSGAYVSYAMMNKEVNITFSDREKTVQTEVLNGTLSDALKEEGMKPAKLKEKYKPSIPWDQKIQEDTDIQLTCKC